MAVIGRLNKSTLSAQQKRQVKKALSSSKKVVYVQADDTVANASETHVAIDNLSVPVEKNKVYKFECFLYFTANASGGAQASLTGSTAVNFVTGAWLVDGATASTPTSTVFTAITTESDATEGTAASVLIRGTGTYSPNDDGVLKISGAQAASNDSITVCKKRSWLSVEEIF